MGKRQAKTERRKDIKRKKITKAQVRTAIGEYAVITFGVFLVAVGVYFFRFPNNISTGGVTGLAIVLNQIVPALSASNFVLIFNVLFLIVGFIVLGRDFGVKTVYGSLLLSGFLELFDLLIVRAKVLPVALPFTGQPVLELFFAVMFPAIGSAILFYVHGSSGGTDIAAMILHKYTSLDSGMALFISDFILVMLTFWNFELRAVAWTTGLLSLAGLILKTLVIDRAIEQLNLSKYYLIITTHREEVEEFITRTLKRGATVWRCEGGYTHREEWAFVAVMSRGQSYRFRRFIKEIDPMAFVVITNSSDIVGKGFKEL